MRKILTIILCFIFVSIANTLYSNDPTSPYLQISVGINSFKNFPSLNYAVKDAKTFGRLMADKGEFTVTKFISDDYENNPVKKEDIYDTIDNFSIVEGVETVVFYYTGHGFNANGYNYIALSETDIGDTDTALELGALFDKLRALRNKKGNENLEIFVFLDACKTTSTKTKKDSYNWIYNQQDHDLQVLYSSFTYGYSYESHSLKSGVFSYYLIDGLNGYADNNNNDGIITFDEIFNYLGLHVSKWSEENGFSQSIRKGIENANIETSITMIDPEIINKKNEEQKALDYIKHAKEMYNTAQNTSQQEYIAMYEKVQKLYESTLDIYKKVYGSNKNRIHINIRIQKLEKSLKVYDDIIKYMEAQKKGNYKKAYFGLLRVRDKIIDEKLYEYFSITNIEKITENINEIVNNRKINSISIFNFKAGMSLFTNLNSMTFDNGNAFTLAFMPTWDISFQLRLGKHWGLGIGFKMFYLEISGIYSFANTYAQKLNANSHETYIKIGIVTTLIDTKSIGGSAGIGGIFTFGEWIGLELETGIIIAYIINGSNTVYVPINWYLKIGTVIHL